MKHLFYKLFLEVKEGKLTPETAQSELVKLLETKKQFSAKIDDTTTFGTSNHNHSKHRVYIDELNYEDAKMIQSIINKILAAI